MRKFNDFEKKILKELYDQNKIAEEKAEILILINFFIENVLNNRALSIDKSQQIMTLVYDKEDDKYAPKEMINFFSLIDYLKSNGLIISFKNDFLSSQPEQFLSKNLTNDGKSYIFPIRKKIKSNKKVPNFSITYPKGYYPKILSLLQQQIQLSPALEHLIEDDFLTISDKALRQAKFQTTLSFIALGLSFLTLGFSWFLTFNTKQEAIKISEDQLNRIINPISNIQEKIDSSQNVLRNLKPNVTLDSVQMNAILDPLNNISKKLENTQVEASN